MNGAADPARRDFLARLGGAAATLALAPGLTLMAGPAEAKASGGRRWGLLIDLTRCASGCEGCVKACGEENGWAGAGRPATDAQWIRKVTVKDR